MEWYALNIYKVTAQDASLFGAIQLILLAAVLIFNISLGKPGKKED